MKSVKTSLQVFGLYLMIVPGLGLMIAPGMILGLFGIGYGDEFWMARMIGMLAFIIGVFEYFTGTYEFDKFYKWTVILRYFAAAFMFGLWVIGEVEVSIILFAAIDALGATWTWLTMK